MIITNAKERSRFIKFTVVGTVGAIVDFGAFNILFGVLLMPEIVAQAISFTLAVASNFIWNRYWTYPDSRSKRIRSQMVQFFLVNLIGLGIRTPIFAVLHIPLQKLAESSPYSYPLSPVAIGNNLALVVAVGIVLFWNFFANRFWTYGDVQ